MNVITKGTDFRVGYISMSVIVYVLNLEYNKRESDCV